MKNGAIYRYKMLQIKGMQWANPELPAQRLGTTLRSGHRFGSQVEEKISLPRNAAPFSPDQFVTSEVLSIVCDFSVDNHPGLDSLLKGLVVGIVSIIVKKATCLNFIDTAE